MIAYDLLQKYPPQFTRGVPIFFEPRLLHHTCHSPAAISLSGMAKELFISYGRETEVIYFVKQLKKDLEDDG